MAKKTSTSKEVTRRQLARREKEQRLQRLLTWIAIAVGAVIVLIVGYGIVTEVFVKANRAVARVGDVKISTKEFQARQRYERTLARDQIGQYESYLGQLDPNDPSTEQLYQQIQLAATNLEKQLSPELSSMFAGQVLDTVIEEELVRQEAAKRGIAVSQDEVDQQIEQMMGYDRSAATSTVTDTMTDTATAMSEEQFKNLYQGFKDTILKSTGFSEDDYRELLTADLLRTRLKEILGVDVSQKADQVEVAYLITGTEEAAQALRERINDKGEDPKALLEELQNDDDDQTSGFELPWLPLGYLGGQLSPELERVAFNTPVGKASEPLLGPDGRYYVAYVSGHEERDLSDALLADARDQQYNSWLSQQKDERSEYLDWQDAVVTEP